MSWTPHATVAVIVETDGQFLMVEEGRENARVFNQPAGHVEENESLLDAARREALEETGWRVEPTDFLGLYTWKAPANGVTYYRFCFVARAIEQVTTELDSDIVAAHWLSYEALQARADALRSPLVMRCIDDYRQGRRWPLEIIRELSVPGND